MDAEDDGKAQSSLFGVRPTSPSIRLPHLRLSFSVVFFRSSIFAVVRTFRERKEVKHLASEMSSLVAQHHEAKTSP